VIVTDSVITDHDFSPKIETVTVSNLFGEAIKRIYDGESVSYLFDSKNISKKITNNHPSKALKEIKE
jgi:ribose-phosphate pyrophosphokinase